MYLYFNLTSICLYFSFCSSLLVANGNSFWSFIKVIHDHSKYLLLQEQFLYLEDLSRPSNGVYEQLDNENEVLEMIDKKIPFSVDVDHSLGLENRLQPCSLLPNE